MTMDVRLAQDNNGLDANGGIKDGAARLHLLETRWESFDVRLASTARCIQEMSEAQESGMRDIKWSLQAIQEATESRCKAIQESTETRSESFAERLASTSRGLQEVSEAQGIWSETVNLSLKAAQDAMDSGLEQLKCQRSELQEKVSEVEETLATFMRNNKVDMAQQLESANARQQHQLHEIRELRRQVSSGSGKDIDVEGDTEDVNGEEMQVSNMRQSMRFALIENRCAALEEHFDQQIVGPRCDRELREKVSTMQAEMESMRGIEDKIVDRLGLLIGASFASCNFREAVGNAGHEIAPGYRFLQHDGGKPGSPDGTPPRQHGATNSSPQRQLQLTRASQHDSSAVSSGTLPQSARSLSQKALPSEQPRQAYPARITRAKEIPSKAPISPTNMSDPLSPASLTVPQLTGQGSKMQIRRSSPSKPSVGNQRSLRVSPRNL
jgi:hypothetical protein